MSANIADTQAKALEEARNYISYGIKHAGWDESQFEDMTDEELIKFAQEAMARADAYEPEEDPGI